MDLSSLTFTVLDEADVFEAPEGLDVLLAAAALALSAFCFSTLALVSAYWVSKSGSPVEPEGLCLLSRAGFCVLYIIFQAWYVFAWARSLAGNPAEDAGRVVLVVVPVVSLAAYVISRCGLDCLDERWDLFLECVGKEEVDVLVFDGGADPALVRGEPIVISFFIVSDFVIDYSSPMHFPVSEMYDPSLR